MNSKSNYCCFDFPLIIRFKQQFIDKRLSMLKAEPEEKKDKEENKIVELPEEEKKAAAVTDSKAPAPPSSDAAAAGLEVMDVAAKKRGESEEREIKEAKKIVETLIPESTKLAGIKEAVPAGECGKDCCLDGKVESNEDASSSAKESGVETASAASKESDGAATSAPSAPSVNDEDDASFERLSKDIVKRSARAVKSLKDNEFDIRFNPDIFQIGVRHAQAEEDLETYEREKVLIKEAADFLLGYQVRIFVVAI